MWPDGETMTVKCPRCDASNEVQIAIVREDDGPCRPDVCQACHVDFEVQPDGKALQLRPAKDQHGFPHDVYVEVEDEPWELWFKRVNALKQGITGPDGWGECYAAGLSPEEAVRCCNENFKRSEVVTYCGYENSEHTLTFA
jgi:hypothetical protein